ncbi:MAG: PAS domain S-box protein [Methylocystis sp.]|uniref:PAS domain S-box protein n=1 Tax=Methylocystis sp. TaxID=1911079 RepID=UPI003DA6C375
MASRSAIARGKLPRRRVLRGHHVLRRDHRAEFLARRGRKAAGQFALWRDGRLATPPSCARRAHRRLRIRRFSFHYRKDGALFHNTLNITPLFDADGRLLYFLGVQYDVSAHVQARVGNRRP